MILQFIVLAFIILVALFLAAEGPLTAVLLLASAIFASALAMGIYEPVSHIMLGWRPGFARGVSFLLIFFIGFSIIRSLFDFLVRGDINLPLWPARISAGIVGFFVGMIVIGSVMIGVEMLPLPATILGFNRYPQGMSRTVGNSTGLWLAPDSFTLLLWDSLSGGAFGGPVAFATVHPDLSRELYGYRHTIQYSGHHAMSPNLLTVLGEGEPAHVLRQLGIPFPGDQNKIILIRSSVRHGHKPPDVSSDEGYLRLTPTEVRLITAQGSQYYPIGYLKDGSQFRPITLNTPIVDDYRRVKGHHVVIQNWVFKIRRSQQPQYLEIKGTARVDLAATTFPKELASLPVADYPQHPYANSSLTVAMAPGQTSHLVHVWVIRSNTPKSHISDALQSAYHRLGVISKAIRANSAVWTEAEAKVKGIPNPDVAASFRNQANMRMADSGSMPEDLSIMIPIFLNSQVDKTTSSSLSRMKVYFNDTLLPLLKRDRVSNVSLSGTTAQSIHIAPGSYVVLAWRTGAAKMKVWLNTANITAGTKTNLNLAKSNLLVDYNLSK